MNRAQLSIIILLVLGCVACKKNYTCVCKGKTFIRYSDAKGYTEANANNNCVKQAIVYKPEDQAICGLKK